MSEVILRDHDEAQRFLLQGLWFQRAQPPAAASVKSALNWSLELVAGGYALPPTGFVADVGHAALGTEKEAKVARDQFTVPGLPPGLARTYEDQVLGKIYADWTFERASDALRRYQGRDRDRGLAFIVRQMREHCDFEGIELPPGIIRQLLSANPEDLMQRSWDDLSANGPLPLLIHLYESLIAAARRSAEVLALADVIALEHRTALAELGQYVAHRQVLDIAARYERRLPRHKVRPLVGRKEVPTRVLDEDTYPVGGFASISTRGSIESLLHSQLAYMEKEKERQPDLFDMKFLRDELYYYSRDENQFLRRRRNYLVVLDPDLVNARFKDTESPAQRIVLLLGLLLTTVNKLAEWLSTDALAFEFLFVRDGDAKPLLQEATLLEMLFRERIENGTVHIEHFAGSAAKYATQKSRRSLCHLLAVSKRELNVDADDVTVAHMRIDGPRPELRAGDEQPFQFEADDHFECWGMALERLLQLWV